jgi:hypothetical protein
VRRVVVDLLGLHRAHDADVVGDRADLREERRDLLARAAEPRERMLGAEALELLVLELGDGLALGERLGHGLAVHLRELRLVVEQLEVRGAACLVDVDDALRLRREVQRLHDPRPRLAAFLLACDERPGVEERREGERAHARARPAQEGAPREALAHGAEVVRDHFHGFLLHRSLTTA